MAAANRLSTSVWGMIATVGMAVVVVLVVALFTFAPSDQRITVVDYAPVAADARVNGALDVALPVPVPEGWQATSVRYRPDPQDPKIATWHLGFYIPGDNYAAIEQTNGDNSDFVKEATVNGQMQGTREIGSQTWTQYWSPQSQHRSLVTKINGVTTVVTGTESYDALADLAASLRTS